MIGVFHPHWRTAVVVRHVAELRAAAARYRRSRPDHPAAN
ncbi:MAG: hypothetical protein K0S78_1756 [Thermomicrobiales bacterium]|jgi:hypothetical protein|nr:hypothetical protein [Thermomicrobiales bacterium]MDF3040968.1 hypothetical protein [Thermomicrobiales bacterium]